MFKINIDIFSKKIISEQKHITNKYIGKYFQIRTIKGNPYCG